MGWQEEQSAARAREQQRQADQRAASARQAESIRQENEARNRANRERSNAEMFAANARRDSERQAREKAASDKAHADRMAQVKREGENMWSSPPYRPSRNSSEITSRAASSHPGPKKSKGGGLVFLILIVGVIYAVGHSGRGSSGDPSQENRIAPIVEGSPQPPVDQKLTVGTPPPPITQYKSGESSPIASDGVSDTAATATGVPSNIAINEQNSPQLTAPSSTLLEPIDRPDAVYPAAALIMRPTGPVIVMVGVQTDGTVISASPESGDSLLMPAALDAARHWTFKPYPYEPGASVRTMRIEFSFVPPTS